MGYTLGEVRHLEQYLEINDVDLRQVEIVGEKVEDVRYPFKKVSVDKALPHGFQVYKKGTCSACENALLLSCQLLEESPSQPLDVYMGKWVEGCVPSGNLKIGFGSCCSGDVGVDKVIKGCPPYPFALKSYLQSSRKTIVS
jgi:hypothetical protein